MRRIGLDILAMSTDPRIRYEEFTINHAKDNEQHRMPSKHYAEVCKKFDERGNSRDHQFEYGDILLVCLRFAMGFR